jgi:hypothetical protein
MTTHHRRAVAARAALAAVGAAACTEVTATPRGGGRLEPALLRLGTQDAPVAAPDTVRAGATFTVAVATFGGGCVREPLAPVLRAMDGATEIALFNHHTGASACTDDLRTIEHRVTLQAPEAGAGRLVLRIVGGARSAESGWQTVPLTVTRTVVVR